MTELLDPGRRRASDTYTQFQELCVRGFLAVRGVALWAGPSWGATLV